MIFPYFLWEKGRNSNLGLAVCCLTEAAVTTLAEEAETLPLRLSYAEMTERFGEGIFGGRQPKRALDGVKEELEEMGVRVETGVSVRKDKKVAKGVTISVAIPE